MTNIKNLICKLVRHLFYCFEKQTQQVDFVLFNGTNEL